MSASLGACFWASNSARHLLGGAMVLLAAALVTGFNPLRRTPAIDSVNP